MAGASRRLTPAAPSVEVRLQYVGHATVLIEFPWLRVLTDPFLRSRLGPLRRHGPEPDLEALGKVDIVLVSHAHPDHFDRRSLSRVPGTPIVVVPVGLQHAARTAGHRVRELRAGEEIEIAGARVTAVPARHWRFPFDPPADPIGYVVDAGARVYFAGDTATLPGIARRVGKVDVALLPVGTWGPHRGGPGHLDPEAAARLAEELRPSVAVPIHWGTLYPVGLHRMVPRPLRDRGTEFWSAARRIAPDVDVRVLRPGESAAISVIREPVRSAAKR
jgi:L-ascorbate metabolism protein UlaG (beta-lactamase superfamily)